MIKRALLLGFFSCSILASEIALTRIFSVIFWYHFGFMILSTAMLGFAVGGLLIRIFKDRIAKLDPDDLIINSLAFSGIFLIFSLAFITNNHFSPLYVHKSILDLLKLVVTSIVLIPPFIIMGATVLYMLQAYKRDVNKLYAANLIGSGVGCLLALVILDMIGGLAAYIILAASMPVIAGIYAISIGKVKAQWTFIIALIILITIPVMTTVFPLHNPDRKFGRMLNDDSVVYSDWTSLSKLDIYKESELHAAGFGLWGISSLNPFPLPERLGVIIDYWAYTTIIKHSEKPGYYNFMDYLPAYMAYRLKLDPSVLVIGSGGGMDIHGALRGGAKQVDAVEINPAIVDAMTGKLAEYSGNIYNREGVTAHLAEGRRFVESSDKTYDIIQLSGVDTYSATQAGAFALSENFLYTTEAMHSYFDHLNDEGIITLTRWYAPGAKGYPRFSMRLFTIAVDALRESGVEDPGKNIIFFRSDTFTVIMIKKSPFSQDEIRITETEANNRRYWFLYRPDQKVTTQKHFVDYLNAKDVDQYLEDYPYNVTAPTDDNPFFFEHRKMANIFKFESFLAVVGDGLDGQTILAILLLEMIFASFVLLWLSRKLNEANSRPLGWLYFAAIGLGFMLVEVSLSQRLVLFLGHPAYALSVVMFSVLVFSGFGSLVTDKLSTKLPVNIALFLVAGFLLLWTFFGSELLATFVGSSKAVRMMIAILCIAPVSFFMGTAFPSAIEKLTKSGENQFGVYWAWNGIASVTASVIAVIIAMSSGFSTVLLLAACCYILAGILLPKLSKN